MTLEEMKQRKKELGYSNERIAALSGVPLGSAGGQSGRLSGYLRRSPQIISRVKGALITTYPKRMRQRRQER